MTTTTRTARTGIRGLRSLREGPGPRRPRRPGGDDRGQTSVEFLGMTPFIILIMLVLWECALIGYTFSLAGNAADVGARKGSGAEYGAQAACRAGAMKDLPDAWSKNARVTCGRGGDLYEATVRLKVPVLVPSLFNLDIPIKGEAGSALED
ncbi:MULTISPECIES: TadE family protein [Streptomyces]|uniref:TadE family protein n=1 Tax=Streptomyces TaxID=1883 RepID=UPI000D519874|nr:MULTISPECIES: TadE family protein [Streptomyces]MXG24867.1 pilus assembly protein [Streptomyces sp. YIM 132580]PVC72758.1 septum formation initiator [Streptomyces sp. CS065A]